MVAWSAGLLLYRRHPALEVLVAHMGGPFWARKDAGAWSIPKGEFEPSAEEPRDAAHREFVEELGVEPPAGEWAELGTFAATSSKKLVVFAADGTGFEASGFVFGEFEMEWPPRSGRTASFPEVDRAEWTGLDAARERLVKGQRPLLDALERLRA
ncbi:NUDIX domain-containing protein [Microbacterium sp. 1P10AE]|uniref:NUDIX domain-containing protein n=1 Tax=Microbacterium sp. 1P10AE TaxID=3132286 RepID=UPI0039A1408F